MKGRHKNKKELDDLHGNPGKTGDEKRTFTASKAKFGVPRGLDQQVRTKIRQFARYLEEAGAPIEFLRPVFERYCYHLQAAKRARWELHKKGPIVKGKKNPAAQVWKDNSQSALQIEQYFEKVLRDTKPPEKEDPADAFLKKSQGKGNIRRIK